MENYLMDPRDSTSTLFSQHEREMSSSSEDSELTLASTSTLVPEGDSSTFTMDGEQTRCTVGRKKWIIQAIELENGNPASFEAQQVTYMYEERRRQESTAMRELGQTLGTQIHPVDFEKAKTQHSGIKTRLYRGGKAILKYSKGSKYDEEQHNFIVLPIDDEGPESSQHQSMGTKIVPISTYYTNSDNRKKSLRVAPNLGTDGLATNTCTFSAEFVAALRKFYPELVNNTAPIFHFSQGWQKVSECDSNPVPIPGTFAQPLASYLTPHRSDKPGPWAGKIPLDPTSIDVQSVLWLIPDPHSNHKVVDISMTDITIFHTSLVLVWQDGVCMDGKIEYHRPYESAKKVIGGLLRSAFSGLSPGEEGSSR